MVYPDGKRADYTYNEHHELVEVKSGNDITTYSYDARGQLTEMQTPNMDITTYTYDGNGNTTNLKTESQNQKIIAEFSSEFDGNDNKVLETSVIDGEKVETSYAYDANEQLTQSNKLSKFEFDKTNVEIATRDEKTEYTYDGSGNKIAEISTINGKVKKKQFNFDKNNKLEDIKSEHGVKYTYDDIGNVTKKKHKDGLVEEYKYDATGQLLNIKNNRGKELTYTYDAMGNRLTKDEVTSISKSSNSPFIKFQKDREFNEEYNADLHIQTSVEQLTNLRRSIDEYNQHRDGSTCNWNDEDGPKESRKHFEYVNDLTTEYTEVLQVYSNNFKPFETFVYGNQRISREDRKGNLFLYQYDAKGSVIGQKNNQKPDELLYKISYNDFGMPNRDLNNEYGYNAEAHDYNGTQYLRARYYDTKTGSFGQRDTFLGDKENPISQNRYTYVWNNPNKYTDPSGHYPGGSKGRNRFEVLAKERYGKVSKYQSTTLDCQRYKLAQNHFLNTGEHKSFHDYAKYYLSTHSQPDCSGTVNYGPDGVGSYVDRPGEDYAVYDPNGNEVSRRTEAEMERVRQQAEVDQHEKWAKDKGINAKGKNEFDSLYDYLQYLRDIRKICEDLEENDRYNDNQIKDMVNEYIATGNKPWEESAFKKFIKDVKTLINSVIFKKVMNLVEIIVMFFVQKIIFLGSLLGLLINIVELTQATSMGQAFVNIGGIIGNAMGVAVDAAKFLGGGIATFVASIYELARDIPGIKDVIKAIDALMIFLPDFVAYLGFLGNGIKVLDDAIGWFSFLKEGLFALIDLFS